MNKLKQIILCQPLKSNLFITIILLAMLALPLIISGTPNWVKPGNSAAKKKVANVNKGEPATYFSKDPGKPGASNHTEKAPPKFLNDGTAEPYGSAETDDDTYIYLTRDKDFIAGEIQLVPFSPEENQHLRDISVIAAFIDNSGQNISWIIVPAKLRDKEKFSEKITVPIYEDNVVVRIELDKTFLIGKKFNTYGIAVFSKSREYKRNYLSVGRGVYIREMVLK